MNIQVTVSDTVLQRLFEDKVVRRNVTRQDIFLFFNLYFPHYIQYQIADFQIEILKLLQNKDHKMIAVVAFRNSAKSTLCSLVLPIWSIIGSHQKKYILLVCQTEQKAQQTLINIRQELEANKPLFDDFGAFYSNDEPWNRNTLVIPKYGARISAVSVGESIRGTRHKEHRPDLIICDDIEDVQSAKMQESRDKLWQFVSGELIPAGTSMTRFVFIGNLVHEDSVMVRMKQGILEERLSGVYREYPLVDGENNILWPGQFPDMKAIAEHKKQQPSEIDYLREYLLKIIPDGDRIIYPEDIHYYDEEELKPRADFQFYIISIDPAVSLKHTADNTAIVIARAYGHGENFRIYLSPHPVNRKLTWPEIIDEVKRIIVSFGEYPNYKIFIEGGSTQKGLAQMLQHEGVNAEEVTPQGQDKRTRLSIAKRWIQNTILFSKTGNEELINQLYTFGTERFDDLVDALTLIVLKMPEIESHSGGVIIVNSNFYEAAFQRAGYRNNYDDDDFDNDAFFGNKRKSKWRNIIPG